jgi:acetyltransferase-like isoleucine patch superfamily enzyme
MIREPSPYLSVDELKEIGFSVVGRGNKISRNCSFYGVKGFIGDNVRVDDFCIIKGHVELHDYCHVASYVMISGAHAQVIVGAFCGLAARTTIFTGSDDYGADTLGCPETPDIYCTRIKGPITFGVGAMIGAHSVVLPNVHVGDGASAGCGCVISNDLPAGGIMRAAPSVVYARRRNWQKIKELALRVLENHDGGSC